MEIVHLPWRESAVPPNYTDILHEVCAMAGVDHALYAALIPNQDRVYTYATYPASWVREYQHSRYHEIDPRLLKSREMVAPLDWRSLKNNPDFERISQAAAPHGIPRNGVTIPIRGPRGDFGLFGLSKDCTEAEWAKLLPSRIGQFMIHAVHFHESVLTHIFGDGVAPLNEPPQLEPEEIALLERLVARKSIPEAATELGLASRTIEMHLRSVRFKLRAVTNAHALMRARDFDLLGP